MRVPEYYTQKVAGDDLNLNWAEWTKYLQEQQSSDGTIDLYGAKYKIADLLQQGNAISKLIVSAGTPPTAEDTKTLEKFGEYVAKQNEALNSKLKTIDQEIAKLMEEKKGKTGEDLKKIESKMKLLQDRKKNVVEQQKKVLQQYVAKHGSKPVSGKAAWWTNVGLKPPMGVNDPNASEGSAGMAMKAQKSAGNGQTAEPGTPRSAKAQTTGGAWSNPGDLGKAMTGPKFSSAAYANSLFMENNIMQSWDSINSNSNRGKQMMMMLFYFMRMAMSGDLYAMYQMVNAVLHIISKDKALQNIAMSQKLIELQDQSRKATDALLNFKQSANDPNNIEFTKMLQKSKAESDSIATSQKLIAQMMEEFAQVVESLTNVTKGLLDAAGRTLKTVSMIR